MIPIFKNILRRYFKGKFYLSVAEPMNPKATLRQKSFTIDSHQSLSKYLKDEWFLFEKMSVNGIPYEYSWEFYVPKDGDNIVMCPAVEMKLFSSAYIAKINAENSGGVLLKAVVLTEDPVGPVKRYFVDHDKELVLDGNTYVPLPMRWDGFEMSASMGLPGMKISTLNLGQQVSDYVEELDILDNDVVLKLLHLDLLGDVQAKDEMAFQVKMIEGDDVFITFDLGMNIGLNDLLPRGVITKDEFPAIVDDVIR